MDFQSDNCRAFIAFSSCDDAQFVLKNEKRLIKNHSVWAKPLRERHHNFSKENEPTVWNQGYQQKFVYKNFKYGENPENDDFMKGNMYKKYEQLLKD